MQLTSLLFDTLELQQGSHREPLGMDHLEVITESELTKNVKQSMALVVFLHDETCQSRWCALEWTNHPFHLCEQMNHLAYSTSKSVKCPGIGLSRQDTRE